MSIFDIFGSDEHAELRKQLKQAWKNNTSAESTTEYDGVKLHLKYVSDYATMSVATATKDGKTIEKTSHKQSLKEVVNLAVEAYDEITDDTT